MRTPAFWKMKKRKEIKSGNGRGNKQQINLSVISIKNL